MKRLSSFLLFSLFMQAITVLIIGTAINLNILAASFIYSLLFGVVYFLSIDEERRNFVAEELRAYASRKQSSNRFALSMIFSFGLIPMNMLWYSTDLPRLFLLQMVAGWTAQILLEISHDAYKKAFCKNPERGIKEVAEYGNQLAKTGISVGY